MIAAASTISLAVSASAYADPLPALRHHLTALQALQSS